MFRLIDLKSLFRGQKLITPLSRFSAQTAGAPDTNFQEEWNNAKPFESIPAMSTIQALRAFLPGGKYYNLSMIELMKAMKTEYGSITAIPAMLGRPKMLMTFNVDDAEKLFRFEGKFPFRRAIETLTHYRKTIRPEIYEEFGGLLSEQNEDWYKMRTLVNPVMLKPATIKLYVPQVDEIAKDFVKMIMTKRDANNEVPANFNDFMNLWSLESITCISLNHRLGLLSENYHDENAEKLIKFIREFFVMAYDFEVNPSIWRYYETKAFKRLLAVYDGLTNIILHYVDKAIENLNSQPPADGREESILEKLVKVNKKVAVVMCADAMLAGVDTTSSATIGILYCLAKNQDKQDKLREELRKILPNKDDALTPDMMRNMPYLRAVIKEGIRFYPPAAGNARSAGDDLVLSGYRVPKGTEVSIMLMLLHRDEKQFEQCEKFIPERWLKSNTDPQCPHAKDSHPFAYLPFGFGPRMCVGKRLAELEIEVLVTRIIRDYKIEWNHSEIKIKSVLVNIPDGDLKFKFTEA